MKMRTLARWSLAMAVSVAVTVALMVQRPSAGGWSTRNEPTRAEAFVARIARRWAVPGKARNAANPVPFSPEVLAEARAHFADHCASCHGNDGSGHTTLGQSFYPKTPDMRLDATQRMTDGELYWIIENGVRLTGMPAWGTGGANDADSWKLVHFIRRLNQLSDADLKEMQSLNPRSPAELEEERADQRFLAGEDDEKEKTQ